MSVTNSDRADVVIVGGGPTGLFLANLLGKAGVNTILLERRAVQRVPSMAIGVMPPSLRMFEAIDLAAPVVKAGCEVRTAVVHDQRRQLGSLDLTVLPSPYAFVLSIPQGDLMHQLRGRLAQWPSVRVMEGAEAVSVCQTADTVRLQVVRASRLPLEEAGQRPAPQGVEITAQFVVACDGNHSRMRDLLGLARVGRRYGVAFIMGDFPDTTTWSHEAHLFFTPQGSVESFPLPNGRRRWIALANSEKRDTQTLVQRVQEIAAVSLDPAAELWHSSFIPERQLAQHYSSGRVVLCGDAAHVMSPIGGQGMNTGFGDVWQLATLLPQLLQTREPHEPCFARYDAERRHAFTIAADRAERGMWLGTRMGKWSSAIRSFVIGRVLLRPPLVRRLPRYFAMLTIPGNDQLMPESENSRATGWRSHSSDEHAARRWG